MELTSTPSVSDNVRNLEEVEGVAKFIQKELEKRGDTLMIRNPDATSRTKNIPAGTQVVSGLMQKLGMTSGDEERLANAMFQLDAAKRSSVNQNPTGTYLSLSKVVAPASVLVLTPEVRQSNRTSVLQWLD